MRPPINDRNSADLKKHLASVELDNVKILPQSLKEIKYFYLCELCVLCGYKQKKPPFSQKERRLQYPKQRYCTNIQYVHWCSLRENSQQIFLIPARFSDLRLLKEPFPLISEQWYNFFRSPDFIEINAYSGATVTAFNRVPFSVINIYFQRTGVV